MTYERIDREGRSIREPSQRPGLSKATIARHTSRTRTEWLQELAAEREAIRTFHDDGGHSWPQTAKHFRLDIATVNHRTYRARKERAQQTADRPQPPLPLATEAGS